VELQEYKVLDDKVLCAVVKDHEGWIYPERIVHPPQMGFWTSRG
jgi:hypothetical protein